MFNNCDVKPYLLIYSVFMAMDTVDRLLSIAFLTVCNVPAHQKCQLLTRNKFFLLKKFLNVFCNITSWLFRQGRCIYSSITNRNKTCNGTNVRVVGNFFVRAISWSTFVSLWVVRRSLTLATTLVFCIPMFSVSVCLLTFFLLHLSLICRRCYFVQNSAKSFLRNLDAPKWCCGPALWASGTTVYVK